MTVNLVYTVFIILIAILFILSIYFLSALAYKKANKGKIQANKESIFQAFEKILGEGKGDLSIYERKLANSFSKGRDIKSFYLAYLKYVSDYGYSQELNQLLNQVVDYKKILKSPIVKKSYRKSYTLHLISQFQLNTEEVGELALNSLDDDSMYVRNNALLVINNQCQLNIVLKALKKINTGDKYYNSRILIDFLDGFKGDISLLDKEILKGMDDCTERFQGIMIEHLVSMGNDDEYVRDKVLDYLKNSKNNEILIKCARYFYRIIDERAAKYIMKYMSSDSWSLRASSVQAISKYPSQEAIGKLKQALSDSNYFVRRNSAISLIKLQDKEQIFEEAYYNEDPFARDILVYTIENMEIKGFKEFKQSKNLENRVGLEWG